MRKKTPKGLKADKKRQAVATLKGYVYQIWQTVYKWIKLKENEVLFLEGAEDIDMLSPEKAETIQVKHTQRLRSVTLRSKEILESIANFWKHQESNPNVKVEFHFLTTAERGREHLSPFGSKGGLDYWDSCKRAGTDLDPLRNFLANQEIFPSELQKFIKDSEDTELRDRLIKRIDWNTGSSPKKYLEDLVERVVINHGNRLGLFPSESKKVVPNLLKYVWDVVCRESNRRLEYHDFLKLFEKVTTISIPMQHLKLLNLASQLSENIGSFESNIATSVLPKAERRVQVGPEFQLLPPPLPDRIVRREKLVSKLTILLENNDILILKGSTGMGKSILARLMIEENENGWRWLNIRGLIPNQIKELFFKEAIFLGDQTKGVRVVIDDIKFGAESANYEYALEGLLYIILSLGGKLIITTQDDIPSRINLNLQISTASFISVPLLKHDEIKKLASNYGCPMGDKLKSWSSVILTKTRGHPQLAHAYAKGLEVRSWPVVTIDDFVKEKDIESIRREARINLADQLPSVEARTFLYKLSLIRQPFRRDHAIALGNKIHGLINPGEIFDLLVGPWIERLNDNYYRVSPLLDNAAQEVYGPKDLKELNKEIAEIFLSCRNLTFLEANVILINGLIGSSGGPILAMLFSLLTAPEKYWPKIANEFWWITAVGLEKGKKIFPGDPFVNTYLRLFQFRIAVEVDSTNLAPKVADSWEKDIEYHKAHELKLLDRMMFILKTVIYYQVSFPPKVIISRIVEAISLAREFEKVFGKPFVLENSRIKHSLSNSLFLFAIVRIKTVTDLNELLTALESLSEENRDELLSLLKKDTDPSEILLNKVFLNEADSKSPQWDMYVSILEKTIDLAFSWKVESLARAAYRTIAVIKDEQQNKPNEALKTLQRAKKQLEYEHPFLGNERAIILYNQKNYKEALKIWEDILPEWPENSVFSPIFHLPFSIDCAAKLGIWSKVKEIALLGEQFAKQYKKPITTVGFRAEYAFALWKDSNFQEAINSFAEVLDQMPMLSDPHEDIHSYKLQKLVGHALAWMTQEVRNRVQLAEPRSGYFSRQEADEKIKDFPLQPVGFMWYFLADLEYKVGSGNAMFERLKTESVNLDLPFINYMIEHIRIGHSLKESKFKSLVSELRNWCKHCELHRKHIAAGHDVFEKVDSGIKITDAELCSSIQHWLPRLLLAALIKLVNRGEYATAPVDDWKANSVHSGFWNNKLEKWFGFIKNAPNINTQELISIMHKGEPEMRCLAALSISAKELMKPSIRYYADILLVDVMKIFPWIEIVDSDIEHIISRNWLRVTSRQSFALKSPAVNSPLIINACKDQSKGLKKAAKILLAAKDAVQISIPDQVIKDLKELSKASGSQIP